MSTAALTISDMPEVVIRDVREDDLDAFREWAQDQGMTVPAAIRRFIHDRADAGRKRQTLAGVESVLTEHPSNVTHEDILETLHQIRGGGEYEA